MQPDELMDGISKEMAVALKAMAKAKTPEEKVMYSEVIKNLSGSLGVFLGVMSEMAMLVDDDPIPF